MKRGTPNHRKMHRLSRRLRVSLAEAVGTMELLWHWVADYLPRGDVGKSEDWEIAAAVHWKGDAEELVRALVEEHWLDEHPTCRLVVHDWPEHCEESVHTRLSRAREFFADGSKPRLGKLGGAERTAAEEFYGSVIAQKKPLETFTLPQQPVLPFSGEPKQHLTDSPAESLTRGLDVRTEGPQKDLAKPSQAKPSLISSSSYVTPKQPAAAACLNPEIVSARLHRFMGGSVKPSAEIVTKLVKILNGHPIETLDAFLESLNGRKIKSYGFFPMVLKKELPNLTAAETPPPPAATPEEPEDVTDYYRWRLERIKADYLLKHGQENYSNHVKIQEKHLVKEYPSVAIMPKQDREILAERRLLNQLSTLPEIKVPTLGDYRRMVQSGEISAGRVAESSDASKETAKLLSFSDFCDCRAGKDNRIVFRVESNPPACSADDCESPAVVNLHGAMPLCEAHALAAKE